MWNGGVEISKPYVYITICTLTNIDRCKLYKKLRINRNVPVIRNINWDFVKEEWESSQYLPIQDDQRQGIELRQRRLSPAASLSDCNSVFF